MKPFTVALMGAFFIVGHSSALVSAGWKDDIGYTQLQSELGAATPTGLNLGVSQVEAPPKNSTHYTPDTSIEEFSDKSFTTKSDETGGNSDHATTVGKHLYGNSTSIAPDINTIDNWNANDWIGAGFLRTGFTSPPVTEQRAIQNHSWVSLSDSGSDIDAIRRFDYSIEQDDYVAVVGLNNGSGTVVPALMAHSYNAIAVGRSDGGHSRGGTRFDEAGRVKPEIVAPLGATSWATPVVGAAAGMLLETGASLGGTDATDATHSETVKALLLAGATKDEFSTWDRTTTRPLDEVYGAGELNIYNSHKTLNSGQKDASSSSLADLVGWDYGTTTGSELLWFFDVDQGLVVEELSAALTWNRIVEDGLQAPNQWGNPTATLANLDLELWSATSFDLGSRLDWSESTVDNVEHIFYENLTAGQYALRMPGVDPGTDFALAWFSTEPVPEPTSLVLLLAGVITILGFRRQCSCR